MNLPAISITASTVAAYLGSNPHMTMDQATSSLIARAMGIETEANWAMDRGTNLEEHAVNKLEDLLADKWEVLDVSIKHRDRQATFSAKMNDVPVSATPDGIVKHDGKTYLVEVKCPVSVNRIPLGNNKHYMDQIQFQLFCANRNDVDAVGTWFYSYFPDDPDKEVGPEYVEYDENYFTPYILAAIQEAYSSLEKIYLDDEKRKIFLKWPAQVLKNPPELGELLKINREKDALTAKLNKLKENLNSLYGSGNKLILDYNGNVVVKSYQTQSAKIDKRAMLNDGILVSKYTNVSLETPKFSILKGAESATKCMEKLGMSKKLIKELLDEK